MWLEFIIAPVMSIYDSRCFDLAHRNIRHLLARIVHTLNPSKPLEPRDIYLTAVSCRSIIAFGMTLLFQKFYELVALLSPPTFSSMVFSWVACSIKSRSMLSLALTNDVVGLNLLILYHLLGYVTFVSHYIDDVTARICCEHVVPCRMFVKNLVTWYVHYLATSHLYQIALMTSPRNMPWHVVTCRGMSLKNL